MRIDKRESLFTVTALIDQILSKFDSADKFLPGAETSCQLAVMLRHLTIVKLRSRSAKARLA